jgi:hypothetical protein
MRFSRAKIYFLASLCLASFGYGVATAHLRVFPFTVIQHANRAWRALTFVEDEPDDDIADVRGLTKPAVRIHSDAAGGELLLVAGGENYLPEYSPEHGCLAWIMDRQGQIVHVWPYDPDVWARFENAVLAPGRSSHYYPIGMHLYPNGDLLVSFQAPNTFPYGIGLARFDKDSKLLWKNELLNHHWLTVAPDGRIICPAFRVVDSPYHVGDTRYSLSSPDGKVLRETVQILDEHGRLLDEIDVLEALINSGWAGLLPTQNASAAGKWNQEHFDIAADDPTHLNGVQFVNREFAAAHPPLKEGDLLLSMRNLNAVGILDPSTKRFKWMSAGTCIQQHSPRFYKDGVMVLDNRGGPEATGGSRLVQIDLETQIPQTVFPQPSSSLPGEFYTSAAGQFELGDSDRALVAITWSQKIWEINLKSGQVLWEYVYVDSLRHRRSGLLTAQYVREVNFPLNRQGVSKP